MTVAGSDILAHYQNGTNASPSPSYNTLVLSKNPILYFRLDEAAFLPTAANFGSLGAPANGFYEMGTTPGLADPNLQAILPGALATAFSTNGIQATNIGAGVDCAPLNDHLLDIFAGGAHSNCTFCAWVNVSSAPGWFQELLARTDNNSFRVDVEPSGDPHWVDASPRHHWASSVADGKWHLQVQEQARRSRMICNLLARWRNRSGLVRGKRPPLHRRCR